MFCSLKQRDIHITFGRIPQGQLKSSSLLDHQYAEGQVKYTAPFKRLFRNSPTGKVESVYFTYNYALLR